jgi:aspartyl-tRNA(Asn)/glutamyl-tRNA(Gln) amidotransferase subunit C
MSVTLKDVEYIATLAKLRFNEDQKEKMTRELNTILHYVEKLNECDTSQVEPLANMNDRTNVLRPDQVIESIPNEDALKNAPDSQERFFKVPKVIG